MIKVAIAGLGTVGGSVYKILESEFKNQVKIVAVAGLIRESFVLNSILFTKNPLELLEGDADIIVELMGGDGIALELCKAALSRGKNIVTANKAMIAKHGLELAKLAEKNGAVIAFEASVGGAIPIIKSVKENFVANDISEICGILNGTCNFILDKMTRDGSDFDKTLKEAQELGFAEADPTFDIEGVDTAHKISILSALAGKYKIDFATTFVEGISKISKNDIKFAGEFGYVIKLLGIYRSINGKYFQAVYPALVPQDSIVAKVGKSYNCVLTSGDKMEKSFLMGRGAGGNPTASAVIGDIIDIANHRKSPVFGVEFGSLSDAKFVGINEREGRYFVNFKLNKKYLETGSLDALLESKVATEKFLVREEGDSLMLAAISQEISEEKFNNSVLVNLKGNSMVSNISAIRVEEDLYM